MNNIRIDIIIPNDEKMDEFISLCSYLEANIVDENHSKNGGTLNYSNLTYYSDILLVAYKEDIPVAFNSLVFHKKDLLYCNQYVVKKEFQNKGIGKRIMESAMKIVDELNVDFSAHVKDYNIASQKVFTSLGFKKVGYLSEVDNYYYFRERKRNIRGKDLQEEEKNKLFIYKNRILNLINL